MPKNGVPLSLTLPASRLESTLLPRPPSAIFAALWWIVRLMRTRNIDMFEASQVKQAPFSFDAEDLLHAWKPVIFCANNIKKNKKYITTALQSSQAAVPKLLIHQGF
ncbi:hypothetical protein PENARI_c004G04826 [Penicillium arizonense]|uniref:Uncharacterized protein n=1 Tax=Penicillium arizonense TaxID=1835702 RepID=A0A1F5LRJ5_PENAI|nr:hypothetical protein PENARI_c004G04826 [Penicillium arizonense]OGE55491.1 hypothetical protein PENARI_c004G04826 [Penicillium arizonense]